MVWVTIILVERRAPRLHITLTCRNNSPGWQSSHTKYKVRQLLIHYHFNEENRFFLLFSRISVRLTDKNANFPKVSVLSTQSIIYHYRFCWPFKSFVTKELFSNLTKYECFNFQILYWCCFFLISDINQSSERRGERERESQQYKLDDWKSVTQWNHVSVWISDCTGDMTEIPLSQTQPDTMFTLSLQSPDVAILQLHIERQTSTF